MVPCDFVVRCEDFTISRIRFWEYGKAEAPYKQSREMGFLGNFAQITRCHRVSAAKCLIEP